MVNLSCADSVDILIKEFLTLLPDIIEKLTDLLKGSFKSQSRDLAIELCLIIPVKNHVLAPYLPILIKPVLLALESTGEIVAAGLKNLDTWVDSTRPDSLEPILKPVMPELMIALFSHLRSSPYPHGKNSLN
jgi:transformation/transcription domain-associated protein